MFYYIFQEVISTPYIVFTKAKSLWLISYKDKKGNYIKKYIGKYLNWSRQKQRKIRTTHGLCEFGRCCAKFWHKPGAVVFWRPYLPHFSSKSYTVWRVGFLTSRALKWYIACKKWTSGSAPKVWKKTAAATSWFFSLCFSLVFSFAWLVLTIQKAVKTLKLATNMIRRHC